MVSFRLGNWLNNRACHRMHLCIWLPRPLVHHFGRASSRLLGALIADDFQVFVELGLLLHQGAPPQALMNELGRFFELRRLWLMVASLGMAQLLDWAWTLVFYHVDLATILQRGWRWLLRFLVLGLSLLEQVVRRCIYQYLLPRLSLNLIWFCIVWSSEFGWITHSAIDSILNRQDFSAQVRSIRLAGFKGIISSSIKCRIGGPDKRCLCFR